MEISRLPSSALRFSDVRTFHQTFASPRHTIKHLGASKCSQIRPFRIEFFSEERFSGHSTNGSHSLKAVPVKAHGQHEDKYLEEGADTKNDVLWRFLRPFPIIFTVVQFSAVLARRLVENPQLLQQPKWSISAKILAVILAQSCANVYATGINQIFDVEIDKINKPYLPISSGQLKIESAWLLVMGFVAISLLTAGALNSIPFLASIFCLLVVHSLYSIPPFRAKISTIGAPITQSMMNGSIQFCTTFAGVGAVLGLPFKMSLPALYMLIFSSVFALSMGLVKDIPDIVGDRENNIPTVATIIGARKTSLASLGICILIHLGGLLTAIIKPQVFRSWIMIPAHIISIFYMFYKAWKMDRANYEEKQSLKTYVAYWNLYFVHLFLFPLI